MIGEQDLGNRMKNINSLNVTELKSKASELGASFPEKVTKASSSNW